MSRKTLNLVTFQDPVWATCQGEGVLVGMPSVFVRMHGCSFSCSWCDTKKSWEEGSTSAPVRVSDTLRAARAFRLKHAVVTGGDPLEQLDPMLDLVVGLREEWFDAEASPKGAWRPGMHVTVETQGAIYDENVSRFTDLLSLSPKLHDWRQEPLVQYVQDLAVYPGRAAQVKVVCQSRDDVAVALSRFQELWAILDKVASGEAIRLSLHFILQPEASLGREGVRAVWSAYESWALHSPGGSIEPAVRIVPQTHKLFGFK